jgi:hypothetical protein
VLYVLLVNTIPLLVKPLALRVLLENTIPLLAAHLLRLVWHVHQAPIRVKEHVPLLRALLAQAQQQDQVEEALAARKRPLVIVLPPRRLLARLALRVVPITKRLVLLS